ncbi:shikimate kinase AroL, partial [Atlantibacter sp.]|uniref:shikimate kinase AroL n=1 Tax=Atlantibacter sp. TaxID=1903473 RepID=UPI0028B06113
MTQPLFLVGPRGCGKTTVGQGLAASLGFHFVDNDRWLLEQSGATVAEIVEQEGWPGFRVRESQALQAVTQPATVIATGGGMVLAEANRMFMRNHGAVIYLQVPAETLAERLMA